MSSPAIRAALKNQYHAALTTLQQTVKNCPEGLWNDPKYENAYWHIAYHALYFTHLYLEQNEAAFHPWKRHMPDSQRLSKPGASEVTPATNTAPYTREEILEYCQFCLEKVATAVDSLNLDHPESGYSWYQMPKLEHQIVNIRHLQHHVGQLADRLRNAAGLGTKWEKG